MRRPHRRRVLLPFVIVAVALVSSLSSSSSPDEHICAGALPWWGMPRRNSPGASRLHPHARLCGGGGDVQEALAAKTRPWGNVQACSLPGLCLRVRGGITVQKMASLGDVKEAPQKLKDYLEKAIAGGLDDDDWTSGAFVKICRSMFVR